MQRVSDASPVRLLWLLAGGVAAAAPPASAYPASAYPASAYPASANPAPPTPGAPAGLPAPIPAWLAACQRLLADSTEVISSMRTAGQADPPTLQAAALVGAATRGPPGAGLNAPSRASPGESLGASAGASAGESARAPTDPEVVLCLDRALAWADERVPASAMRWYLCCRDGKPLAVNDNPLLEAITAGKGIALVLWQADQPGQRWRRVRRLHIPAPARHGQAIGQLPAALARLLRQACIDHRLGVRQALHPRLAAHLPLQAPRRAPGLPTLWLHRLQGQWRFWLDRQRARWLREQWFIGVIDAPIGQLLSADCQPAVHWLDNPDSGGYWADPMAAAGDERRLYCEYFDERAGIGRVERLDLDASGRVNQRVTLAVGGGTHTSFPLMVEINGQRLGLAETGARRECVLHEIDADGQWQPLATLVSDVAVADPALFFWEQRYWLALTDMDLGASDNLCLYHADHLLGPWTPHANNPVKVDVTSARMAGGFFWHQGRLYRPAQDCLAGYGAGVVLMQVLRCTPTEFEEVPVRQLRPDAHSACPHGIHTVSAWGQRTLIDGKRRGFSLAASWRKLRRRLRSEVAR